MLSAGAVKPGLTKLIEAFERDRSVNIQVEFATAPAIAKRITNNESFDIVIAPTDQMKSKQSTLLGRIGVGVMLRDGAAPPNIATVERLKQTLLDSDSLVFNQASTGLYIDNLLKRLAIAAHVEARITRCGDFAAVRQRIADGRGNAIGFGATTVIVESAGQGVTYAGPLPAELQNYTSYAAALTASADDAAKAFMDYLASPAAAAILKSIGID